MSYRFARNSHGPWDVVPDATTVALPLAKCSGFAVETALNCETPDRPRTRRHGSAKRKFRGGENLAKVSRASLIHLLQTSKHCSLERSVYCRHRLKQRSKLASSSAGAKFAGAGVGMADPGSAGASVLALAGISEHRNSPCLASSAKTARAAASLFLAALNGSSTLATASFPIAFCRDASPLSLAHSNARFCSLLGGGRLSSSCTRSSPWRWAQAATSEARMRAYGMTRFIAGLST